MAILARYFLLGGVSFGLGILLSWNFHENLQLSQPVSVAITLVILFILNFFMARSLIFRNPHNILEQVIKFTMISLSTRATDYILFLILFYVFNIHYLFSYMISVAAIYFPKYLLYKNVVFKSNKSGEDVIKVN
jgi:putative flippase GtrA